MSPVAVVGAIRRDRWLVSALGQRIQRRAQQQHGNRDPTALTPGLPPRRLGNRDSEDGSGLHRLHDVPWPVTKLAGVMSTPEAARCARRGASAAGGRPREACVPPRQRPARRQRRTIPRRPRRSLPANHVTWCSATAAAHARTPAASVRAPARTSSADSRRCASLICARRATTSRASAGLSVISPSTPWLMAESIHAGSLTVHTKTSCFARCVRRTKAGGGHARLDGEEVGAERGEVAERLRHQHADPPGGPQALHPADHVVVEGHVGTVLLHAGGLDDRGDLLLEALVVAVRLQLDEHARAALADGQRLRQGGDALVLELRRPCGCRCRRCAARRRCAPRSSSASRPPS